MLDSAVIISSSRARVGSGVVVAGEELGLEGLKLVGLDGHGGKGSEEGVHFFPPRESI